MASAYERARLVNIARNEAKLRELEIGALKGHIREQQEFKRRQRIRRKRKAPSTSPTRPLRRSRRAKRQPPPALYTTREADEERKLEESQRQNEISNGWRNSLGVWRGERFGEVPGVPVGTVFGSGDYQRLGRFEMSRTGFFKPIVTPEWIDNATKEVYAVVFNNDNGLSADKGDVIEYAGSGGRMRGQNRTAEQSFHQNWKSATNAALRRNFESGRPVRVIRGPKCRGKYGTKDKGGGYRYDGLYTVEKAEMRETGRRKLRTAMFTLRQIQS
eukprot:g1683.t1